MSWYRGSEAWLPAWAVLGPIYRSLQVRSASNWASVWQPFECRELGVTSSLVILWQSHLEPLKIYTSRDYSSTRGPYCVDSPVSFYVLRVQPSSAMMLESTAR